MLLGVATGAGATPGRFTLDDEPVQVADHPGEILAAEFHAPLGISHCRLAQATGLSQTHISQIVKGKRRIIPDAGLRIARALGVSDRDWIDLQTNYDTILAKITHAEQIAAVEPIVAA